MSKQKKPNLVMVDRQHRTVITSEKHPRISIIIGEEEKPFRLFILLQSGIEISLDKNGNVSTYSPKIGEVF